MPLVNPNFPTYEPVVDKVDISPIVDSVNAVREAIESIELPEPESTVDVRNLDEIRLYLKKELSILADRLDKSIRSIDIPEAKEKVEVSNLTVLVEEFAKLLTALKGLNLSPTINVAPPVIPEIGLPEINVPEIKVPPIFVPEPRVTVNPTVDIDVSSILDALDPLKFISDRPNKPIAVRLSDGQKFVKALQQLKDSTDQLGVVYAGSSGGIDQAEFKTTIRNVDNVLGQYRINDVDDDASPNYYGFQDASGGWYILKETISAGANTYRYAKGSSAYTTNWTGRAALSYDYFDNVF